MTYVTSPPAFSAQTPILILKVPYKEGRTIADQASKPRKQAIAWHTAFRDVIQLALYPYRDRLSFQFEYVLNSEPLRIDAVIITKEPGVVIDNPIGAIFRRVNIVEYKSPGDHLSVSGFHQVNAYGHLYSVLNRVETKDMTLSFVTTAHPRKLLDYLRREYGFAIREGRPGIYYVEGGIFTTQIIESKRLEGGGGGIGLRDLRGGLNEGEFREIIKKIRKLPKGTPLSAYLRTMVAANESGLRGMIKMADVLVEEVLEELGLLDKWQARALERVQEKVREEVREEAREEGREEKQGEAVKKLQKYGMKPRQIAEALELPLGTVSRYLKTR